MGNLSMKSGQDSEHSSPLNSRKESVNKNGGKKSQQQGGSKKETSHINYNEQPVYPAKYTDSDNSEDEGMEDYKVGGYHPVHVG